MGESRTPFCGKAAPLACTLGGSSVGSCSSRRSGAGLGSLLPATRGTVFRHPACTNHVLFPVCVQVFANKAEATYKIDNYFDNQVTFQAKIRNGL